MVANIPVSAIAEIFHVSEIGLSLEIWD